MVPPQVPREAKPSSRCFCSGDTILNSLPPSGGGAHAAMPRVLRATFGNRQVCSTIIGVRPDTTERKPRPAAPKQKKLIMASSGNPNAVCGDQSSKSPALTVLRRKIPLRLVSNRAGRFIFFGSPSSPARRGIESRLMRDFG